MPTSAIWEILSVQQKCFHSRLLPHKHHKNSKNVLNQRHCFGEITLDYQDRCHGKSPGLWGAFFAFTETKESKTMGRLCSSLTINILMVEVFNNMCAQSLWTSEYPPCIWWYVWGENRQTSVSGKWYKTQGKYAGFPLMSVNLWRVVPIPTTVLTFVISLSGFCTWHSQ